MSIQILLANFVMCCIWLYMSVLFVHVLYRILSYLVEMREKRMKLKIDSTADHEDLDQHYEHNDYLHKQQYPIYVR